MTPPRSEAGADALRDALALVRASLDGDDEAVAVLAGNVAWPALTLAVLAEWNAGLLQRLDIGRDELDEWQSAKGLR